MRSFVIGEGNALEAKVSGKLEELYGRARFRAKDAYGEQGRPFDDAWLQHIAPVHWNHINLTGDYSWRQNKRVEKGGLRPLRMPRA